MAVPRREFTVPDMRITPIPSFPRRGERGRKPACKRRYYLQRVTGLQNSIKEQRI
jgi:hypothetical protein